MLVWLRCFVTLGWSQEGHVVYKMLTVVMWWWWWFDWRFACLTIPVVTITIFITLRAVLSLAAQCIVIGPVCGFLCMFMCVFVGLLPR